MVIRTYPIFKRFFYHRSFGKWGGQNLVFKKKIIILCVGACLWCSGSNNIHRFHASFPRCPHIHSHHSIIIIIYFASYGPRLDTNEGRRSVKLTYRNRSGVVTAASICFFEDGLFSHSDSANPTLAPEQGKATHRRPARPVLFTTYHHVASGTRQ
jgi:hypothetical protein